MRPLARLLFSCLFAATILVVPSPAVAAAPPGTTVIGWGWNEYGQTTVPPLPDGVTYAAVSAGYVHSMALRSDATVAAWGDDSAGQSTVPTGLDHVVAISAGGYHSLALKDDGTVTAWGYDIYGQSSVPAGLDHVTAIAAGQHHSLALRDDGTVVAWGVDGNGESTVPPGLDHVVAISAGGFHSLALKEDGTVVSWGLDHQGQTTVPNGLDDVVAVSAGGFHSLALKGDGTITAWGSNEFGQVNPPQGLGRVVAISAGVWHSVALTDDGRVTAWGDDGFGQAEVPDALADVSSIAASAYHSLALGSLRGDQTVTFTSTPPDHPTIGQTYQATATGGGSGNPITYSVHPDTTNSACTVNPTTGLVTFQQLGECWIRADQDGNDEYLPGHAVQHVGSVKRAQTIDTNYLPRAGLVGWGFPLSAYADPTGNPVVFSSATPGVCTVTPSGYVTYLAAGTCTLRLDAAGDSNHHPATTVTWHLMVFGL